MNTFQTLYGRSKQGKTLYWQTRIEPIDEYYQVCTEYGELGTLRPQYTKPTIFKKGKNIGKSNETTAYQQALQFAERKWTDKQEKQGYSTSKNTFPILYPMLANKLKNINRVEFPAYAQPKLDGVRCIAYRTNGVIQLFSRTGKQFTGLTKIENELEKIFAKYPDVVLDGELGSFPLINTETKELIKAPEMTFQETCGYIKRQKKKDTDKEQEIIEFHIFDCIQGNKPWDMRYNFLFEIRLLCLCLDKIKIVETCEVNGKEQFLDYHQLNISRGFEGTIYRAMDGVYKFKYRSNDLLKYKDMVSEEYPIIGFQEGRGNDIGTVIWTVDVDGLSCKVRPRGSREHRKELFNNAHNYIGKMLTVQYQEKTDSGLPRFPVGIVIRDYE